MSETLPDPERPIRGAVIRYLGLTASEAELAEYYEGDLSVLAALRRNQQMREAGEFEDLE